MPEPPSTRPDPRRGLRSFPAAGDRAVREMAGMFDQVSPRYDLLNSLMTLGEDRAWRAALARAVPDEAHVVLDLCTGSGASLEGLTEPGRLVLGVDASLGMLERAAADYGDLGWAPRLACADAFRLPLRDASVDAVTIAFGMRNLRPRPEALAELARVLVPGGTLAVLEATAPGRGPLSGLHAFHLRRLVPLLGRISSDPDAYRYLAESIFDFGSGPEFERDLAAAGFGVRWSEGYLLGAARLWSAQRLAGARPEALRNARSAARSWGKTTRGEGRREREWRWWTAAQALFTAALTASLVWALVTWVKWRPVLRLDPWQDRGLWILILAGMAGFGVRTLVLFLRVLGPAPDR